MSTETDQAAARKAQDLYRFDGSDPDTILALRSAFRAGAEFAAERTPAPAPSVVPEAAVEAFTEWGVDESDVAALREAAVEAVAWKLIDRTSDLADRAPSDETWRTANADARAALPLLTAAPSATREEVGEALHPGLFSLSDYEYARRFDNHGAEARAQHQEAVLADEVDPLLARFTITPKEDR